MYDGVCTYSSNLFGYSNGPTPEMHISKSLMTKRQKWLRVNASVNTLVKSQIALWKCPDWVQYTQNMKNIVSGGWLLTFY